MIYDFICGGTGPERAVSRNRDALADVRLIPRALRDVTERDLGTTLLDRHYRAPFGIAPMGMSGLAWAGADQFIAAASREFGIPACASSFASIRLEDMRRLAGDNAWFQLYAASKPEFTDRLVGRARDCDYETLVLTVDVPVIARRNRDIRNGLAMPMRIGPKQAWDLARHPFWSLAMLNHGIPRPANFPKSGPFAFTRGHNRAYADWEFLARLRDKWKGRLIVKGIMSTEDARRIVKTGADAIWVSNHGGRQLDSAPATASILPDIRQATGAEFPLLFDSGIRDGNDIVAALALGADFVMLGRPALLALGAGGPDTLSAYFNFLCEEVTCIMAQLGTVSVSDIGPSCMAVSRHVTSGLRDVHDDS